MRHASAPVTAALLALVITVPSTARAMDCLEDNGQPPASPLVGTLRLVRTLPPFAYQAQKTPFWTLELDEPVCLKGAVSGEVRAGIRSVQVFATDPRREALLKRHRNRRVSIALASVFEEHTAYHRRPMVGAVEQVAPAR